MSVCIYAPEPACRQVYIDTAGAAGFPPCEGCAEAWHVVCVNETHYPDCGPLNVLTADPRLHTRPDTSPCIAASYEHDHRDGDARAVDA